MTTARCARVGLGIAALAVASAAYGQGSAFTEAQSAAGRASYLANCAGCHLADLRGNNEARPLVGPDFMRTWSGRTAQELVAFLGVTMPPPPAAPGSLGPQSYVTLAAFLLHANGAAPGTIALTASSGVPIGSIATGTMSEAFRAGLASAAPALAGGAAGRTGISVVGEVAGFKPVTDAMLRRLPADDWLMIRGNYQAWNYSELAEITRDNVDGLTLEWVWAMTDGGWNEPAPVVHDGVLYSEQHGQHHPGARRGDRRAHLGESRRAADPGRLGDARARDLRRQAVRRDERCAARRARRAYRPNRVGNGDR